MGDGGWGSPYWLRKPEERGVTNAPYLVATAPHLYLAICCCCTAAGPLPNLPLYFMPELTTTRPSDPHHAPLLFE